MTGAAAVVPLHEMICPDCSATIVVEHVPNAKAPTGWVLDQGKVQAALDHHLDHECPGVPVAAELAAWNDLCEVDACVQHGGDATIVTGHQRPAWAAPEYDVIGRSPWASGFRSVVAALPLDRHEANDKSASWMTRSEVLVGARHFPLEGEAGRVVGVTVGDEGLTLTLSEARRFAGLLNAAADLAESNEAAS